MTGSDSPAAGDVENEDDMELTTENATSEQVDDHDSDGGSTESSDSENKSKGPR